jgi:hypothetical protein
MSTINQVAYLKSSREFPPEINQIAKILTRSYVEIANAINTRTIGLFPSNRPAITGNAYFFTDPVTPTSYSNQKQQSLRQVYVFSATTPIPHGIDFNQVSYIGAMYGQFLSVNRWCGLIPGTTVAIPGQISFNIGSSNINFVVDAGAPAFTKGIIVIEWISQP